MNVGMAAVNRWTPRQRLFSLVGAGTTAWLLCIIGAFFDPVQFFSSYLVVYSFVLGIGLGSLVILMIYHLTGGAWGFMIRRILEASVSTLPLLAVLFIPIIFGARLLYTWARPEALAVYEGQQHKQIYLNVPFFIGRAVLYFACWWALAFFLHRWSANQDHNVDEKYQCRLKRLSGPGLVVYGITITFASVDWIMSLETGFRSTIFGPLIASTQLLSALAFALLVYAVLARRPPLRDLVSADVNRDLGNLLLTFVILWGYMVLFQFVLIWIADLRYEVIWYLPRIRGGWVWVAWSIVIFGFTVPFFCLLMRDWKENLFSLMLIAGLLLLMQLVFAFHQIQPSFHLQGLSRYWMNLLMPIALGSVWFAYFLWQFVSLPPLPEHDLSRESTEHLRRIQEEEIDEESEAIHA